MKPPRFLRSCSAWLLALACALLTGCATGPQAHPADPLEPLNRKVDAFNQSVDKAVLKPVATTYRDNMPVLLQKGVHNFFTNLGDAWSFVNNALQFKGQAALESLVRFNVNTVFGIGGIFDIASEMRIPRHRQDFGQTLGYWGVPTGPYLVLPLFGPSSVRDTAGLLVDSQADLLGQVHDIPWRNTGYGARLVDTRANLLGATDVLEQAALDRYSFTRDVYLRLRGNATGKNTDGRVDGADSGSDGSLPDGDGAVPEEPEK